MGTIPEENISLIAPDRNKSEQKIENVYSHITEKKPNALFVFYSGHEVCERRGQQYFDVSDKQGDALNISRLRDFIKNLLSHCSELFVIIDCCYASAINLLPEDPGVDNPNHIEFCSSKSRGVSYLDIAEKAHSTFGFCVISALRAAAACHEKMYRLKQNAQTVKQIIVFVV